tara:strand:+ start:432 stop:644 length:213 start_codon:yes stop_codon:yes gene_type:complete
MILAYIASVEVMMDNNISLTDIINTSINMDDDQYNMNGVNISAAGRRQDLIPWTSVEYNNKRSKKSLDDI